MATQSITLSIDDVTDPDVVNDFCASRGYDDSAGMTKAEFIKADLIAYVNGHAFGYRVRQAEKAAGEALVMSDAIS